MSITSTFLVRRSDAIRMIQSKGLKVLNNSVSNLKIGMILDVLSDNIFENYLVVGDNF